MTESSLTWLSSAIEYKLCASERGSDLEMDSFALFKQFVHSDRASFYSPIDRGGASHLLLSHICRSRVWDF